VIAKRTIQTTVFDSSDGVRSVARISTGSPHVAKSTDGKLWFATLDGLSVVDPRHLAFQHTSATCTHRADHRRPQDVRCRCHCKQPHDLPALTRDLQIDYTALSLVVAEKNRFKSSWKAGIATGRTSAPGGRLLQQSSPRNLPVPRHREQQQRVWNETGAVLDFCDRAAYYQTAWFRTLAIVTFLSLLWAAHRLRLRVVERHEPRLRALNDELMKAQEQERTRIAGELHDGVMQQISALTLMLGHASENSST
jgi:hypothetical protein